MNLTKPTIKPYAPIGVFDSGVGGLTVVKEIYNTLPNESIIYFGDTARVPYGSKSKETVKKFSLQILRFLLTHKVKLIVVACNTASSFALQELKNHTEIPVVGVIGPVAAEAVKITSGRIGVIGTEGTIRSRAYEISIRKYNNKIKIFSQACPLFVPLIEQGFVDGAKETIATEIYDRSENGWTRLIDITKESILKIFAENYLQRLIKANIDTLILGCTHYPLIENIIRSVVNNKIKIVNSAVATANYVKKILTEMQLLASRKKSQDKFYVSDAPEKFISLSKNFLGKRISDVKKIDIEEF